MTALSAWRPLQEAPKDKPVVVDSSMDGMVVAFYGEASGWFYWRAGTPQSLGKLEPYKPIAEAIELDRAVQILIVQAIAELIAKVQFAEDRKRRETARRWAKSGHDRATRLAERTKAVSIRQFAWRLHQAFGITQERT